MTEGTKEVQLRTFVSGIPEAKAQLREFVESVRAASAEATEAQKKGATQAAQAVGQIENRALQNRESAASEAADKLKDIEKRTTEEKLKQVEQADKKVSEISARSAKKQEEADKKAAATWNEKVADRIKGIEKQAFGATEAITGVIGKALGALGLLTVAWEAAKYVYEKAAGAQKELASAVELATDKVSKQRTAIDNLLGAAEKLAAGGGLLTAELTAQERLNVAVNTAKQAEAVEKLNKTMAEEERLQLRVNAARKQGGVSALSGELEAVSAEREALAFQLRGLQEESAALVQRVRKREGLDRKAPGAAKVDTEQKRIEEQARRFVDNTLSTVQGVYLDWQIASIRAFDAAMIEQSDKAVANFSGRLEEQKAMLLREAEALQSILERYTDLPEADRARLQGERDSRLAQLPAETQAAFQGRADGRLQQAAGAAVAEGGLLAYVGEVDPARIAAIGDALHAGIVSPLSIAADTARDFGGAMADAAASAILEGKSIKEATNGILKQIARRALASAIFHSAAALGSLAFLDFRGAALHGKAAATFGIVAALGAAGAAVTGGLREGTADSNGTAPRGVETPRTTSDRGTAPVVNQTFYISQTGLRNRAEDYAFVVELMNEGASLEGALRLDSRTQAGAV